MVGPAPSIRVTLGECFGLPIGTNVEGKMVTALRRLGFDKVFDLSLIHISPCPTERFFSTLHFFLG